MAQQRIRHVEMQGPFTLADLDRLMMCLRLIDREHGGREPFTARIVDPDGEGVDEAAEVLDRIWPEGDTPRVTTTLRKMDDPLRQLVVLLASREHARLTMDGEPDPHLKRAVDELFEIVKLCEGADTVVLVSKGNRDA